MTVIEFSAVYKRTGLFNDKNNNQSFVVVICITYTEKQILLARDDRQKFPKQSTSFLKDASKRYKKS